jgi:hypothetical protein
MHLIYNSDQYSVVEFGIDTAQEALRFGAFEIVDKPSKREIFIGGSWAEAFRQHVQALVAGQPSSDDIDDFLATYEEVMHQPVVMH